MSRYITSPDEERGLPGIRAQTRRQVANAVREYHLSTIRIKQNLGSIWASPILISATTAANTYNQTYSPQDHKVEAAYKSYVKTVLEVCSYLADQKRSHGVEISGRERDWEVVQMVVVRDGLGLTYETYQDWKALDFGGFWDVTRHHDGSRTTRPKTLSEDDPLQHFKEYIQHQKHIYQAFSGETLHQNPAQEISETSLQSLSILNFRMSLMNYATILVSIIQPPRMLPACQQVSILVENGQSRFQGSGDSEVLRRFDRMFIYVLREIVRLELFPGPVEEEQGVDFDKPRNYVAWCVAELTVDRREAQDMIGVMLAFRDRYYSRIKTFVDMDPGVMEKKKEWLDALKESRELPESLTTFGMVKDWFLKAMDSDVYKQI